MAVGFSDTNKPINPRGNDASPKGYNKAELFSGKALDFDGVNDYVDIGSFSMSGNNATFVFNYNQDVAASSEFVFDNEGARVSIGQGDVSGSFGIDTGSIAWKYFGSLESNKWYSIAVIIQGSTARCYANGVPFGDAVDIGETLNFANVTNATIGARYSKTAANFDGQIAGFKIFNTALTAAQVADLYNNPEKIVPTGVADSALKLYLPMMEGAGTTAYDGSPVGFTEDIVTGFTNGTTYPLDSFASSGDDITTAIKTNGFGGCVSNGHTYTNGQKVKVKFTYQKNSGNDLRVLFSNVVTGAGTAKSDIQNVSASGEFEHIFTMTADGTAYLQLGTGNAAHSIDAVITDVYVSPNVSANHGTISGATYTHGIGAPVAQTAVIDWNKGTNLVQYSEQFDNAAWVKSNSSVNANTAVSPSGNTDADLITSSGSEGQIYQTKTLNGSHTFSAFFKAGTSVLARLQFYDSGAGTSGVGIYNLTTLSVSATGLSSTGTITDYGNGWYRCTLTASLSGSAVLCFLGLNENAKNILAWGAQINAGSVGPYVRTGATAQTSDVLLPAGLTTGRDITGVNLFENVRKQGALNLDGNSWAEVHDNASVDLTTAISMECWAYIDDLVSTRVFFAKWAADSAQRAYVLYQSGDDLALTLSDGSNYGTSSTNVLTTGWHHIVATYVQNGNMTYYVDGSQTDAFAFTRAIRTTTAEIEIGRNEGPTGANYFKNQIAQPRIYNRALTAEEVARNYNNAKSIYTNS